MNLKLHLNIIDKKNSLESLKKEIKKLGYINPLIVCDKIFEKNQYINEFTKRIKKKYIEFSSEPSYEKLDSEIRSIKKIKKVDCIIGIGGGSTIDFSKGVALLYKNTGSSVKFMGFPKKINKPLPVIAIPTTVSTGSEVVFNAVFTHIKNKKKLGINSELNYPVLSILDVNLIKYSPKKIIYQSAISSLLRSIETYTSKDANEITKMLSLKSFQILTKSLNAKIHDYNFYNNLQWGCILSILALSNSSGHPGGVINYYLSVNYNISQPLAYNFTSIEFIKRNIEKGYLGYSNLIGETNEKKIKKIYTKKFLLLLKKILKKNLINVNKAKSILKLDNDFESKIYNIFKENNFSLLTKNPLNLTKKDLKKIIINIKE